jgi:hypothetical protein
MQIAGTTDMPGIAGLGPSRCRIVGIGSVIVPRLALTVP